LVWVVPKVNGRYIDATERIDTTAFLKVTRKEALLLVDQEANLLKPVDTLVCILRADDYIVTVNTKQSSSTSNVPYGGASPIIVQNRCYANGSIANGLKRKRQSVTHPGKFPKSRD
jgi:hypothetical protein